MYRLLHEDIQPPHIQLSKDELQFPGQHKLQFVWNCWKKENVKPHLQIKRLVRKKNLL